MNERRKTKLSKRLSLVLRHKPASIGIELDEAGWVAVEVLLGALKAAGVKISNAELEEVVRTNSKMRFAFDDSGDRIRANQGHSVDVDLGYQPSAPPPVLYHGTHEPAVASIFATGLEPRGRHHVHLSRDLETARVVGARRGTVVVLEVDAAAMEKDGASFFVTPNHVWLTAAVDPRYLRLFESTQGDKAGQ